MSKRFLLSIVLVLIVTNVATLLFWNQNDPDADTVIEDKDGKQISTSQPVATIGDVEILYEDWKNALQADHGEVHLKKLIDQTVVTQLAEQKDIQISEKVIDYGVALLTTMQSVMTEEE